MSVKRGKIMIEIRVIRIPSSDGKHKLYCRLFTPVGEAKGLFHVVHGMAEHIRRYEGLMREMAERGYICYGFDNLGHGCTAESESELGCIEKWEYMVEDVQTVTRLMKKKFGKSLPCFLLGHSMGSFIARCAANPNYWDKVIFMGTGGPNPASDAGLALIKAKIKKHGGWAEAHDIEKLIFGGYSIRFKDEHDVLAWLSTKKELRDKYRADKYCSFHFKLSGYYTLVKLQSICNRKTWFKHISGDLPVFLVSGSDDPVGSYGKGVTAVYNGLKKQGKDVRMKLYDGFRHEILNDSCSDEVIEDILAFIS